MALHEWIDKAGQARLYELARDDVIIARYLQTWQHGGYPTYEQMLVQLCCVLSEQRMATTQDLIDCKLRQPPAPIIIDGVKHEYQPPS